MKKSQLRQIIKEEIKRVLKENINQFEDYISGKWDSSVTDDTIGLHTTVLEKEEDGNPSLYNDADEFMALSEYLKSNGGRAKLEGNPDIILTLTNNGDIVMSGVVEDEMF